MAQQCNVADDAQHVVVGVPATCTPPEETVKVVDFVPQEIDSFLFRRDVYEDHAVLVEQAEKWMAAHPTARVLGVCVQPVDTTERFVPNAGDVDEVLSQTRYKRTWVNEWNAREWRRYGVWVVARVFFVGCGGELEFKDFLPNKVRDATFGTDEYETLESMLTRAVQWVRRQQEVGTLMRFLNVSTCTVFTDRDAELEGCLQEGRYRMCYRHYENVVRTYVYHKGKLTYTDERPCCLQRHTFKSNEHETLGPVVRRTGERLPLGAGFCDLNTGVGVGGKTPEKGQQQTPATLSVCTLPLHEAGGAASGRTKAGLHKAFLHALRIIYAE